MMAVTGGKAAQRLDSFKRLLAHIRESLTLDVGVVLWDKSTVPANLSPDALAIVIADEGVVAAMIRRPNLDTFLNLWATGRMDIRNGAIFDAIALRPKLRTREIVRRIDKRLVFATALKFLFVPRGGPWPLENIRGHEASRDGSKATNADNVHYHYDLSNAFYALFLDPEMVYTCAYFRDWDNDLATAQRDKLDMICRKLRLKPGDRLLDIGCGWGALICHAAQHYGAHALGVTLSKEQFSYATEKIARLGLNDKVTVELRDYSLLEGEFDKIASIGMFEHVGNANHESYFQNVHRLLKPGGLYLHHSIALRTSEYDRLKRRKSRAATAVVRYIFPGGELDHLGMSIGNLERQGFEVHDVEAWREHYARTTRHWHDRLSNNRTEAEREAGSVKTRLWIIWLGLSSIGFARGTLNIFQTLTSKRTRGASGLPPTRSDLYS